MSEIRTTLSNIDWTLLRKQKAALVATEGDARGESSGEHILGIIHLLDAIQDAVVADGLASEETVFGRLTP